MSRRTERRPANSAVESSRGVGAHPIRLSGVAVLSAQVGFVAVACDLLTFALFGPAFEYRTGFALLVSAMGLGTVAILLAHWAGHSIRRDPYRIGRAYATLGTVLGYFALLVAGGYVGLVYFLFHPFIAVAVVTLGALLLAVHFDMRVGEDDFRRTVNRTRGTAQCHRCGRVIPLSFGGWRSQRWLCPACIPIPGRSRMSSRALVVGLAGIAMLSLVAPAQVSAFCEIAEPPTPIPTQVNGTQVEIQLTEGFARVVIIKEFYNPSDEFKEGQVFFPLEKGRELITDLRLKIGNVVYGSVSQDRDGALEEFLEKLQTGQDAALVQYDPPRDVYWIAVTIPPKQARTTITTLEMPLAAHDGLYSYDYRLSVDARDSVSYLRAHIRVETTDALEEVRIPTHRTLPILRSGDRTAEMWVNSSADSRGRDLRVEFRSSGPRASQLALANGDRYVRLTVDSNAPDFSGGLDPRPRSFLIFVDGSGSMGLSGRWPLAVDTAMELLRSLGPEETFAIATFRGRDVNAYSRQLLAGEGVDHQTVRDFLTTAILRGSTNFAAILDHARVWAEAARSLGQQPLLFLISDGRVTQGPRALALENAFKQVAYQEDLPMSGFVVRPADHSDDNAVRNLTHFNRGGFYTVVGDYVPTAVSGVLAAIRTPVLHDVHVSLGGLGTAAWATSNPQRVVAGGELVVLARTRGRPEDPIHVALSWTGSDQARRAHALSFDGDSVPRQPLLHREWVMARIHTLLDRLRGGQDPEIVDEIRALATENRIVTPYTSLLVTIPRVEPRFPPTTTAGDSEFLGGFDFPGSPPTVSPAALSDGSDLPPTGSRTPLGAEAERWAAWRSSQRAALITENEIDRWVSTDDAALRADLEASQLRGEYTVVFKTNLVTVYEGSGELVAVRDPILDPASSAGRTTTSVAWAGLAGFAFIGAVAVHNSAAKVRRRIRSPDVDPGFEG